MRIKTSLLVPLAVLLLVAACSPAANDEPTTTDTTTTSPTETPVAEPTLPVNDEPASGSDLEGSSWILSGILADDVAETSKIDATITAAFADGQLTGSAGCNRYFTSYETAGSALMIGPISSTEMACDEARGQRETEYLTTLSAISAYALQGDTLELSTADGAVLRFTADVAATAPEAWLGTWC